ncbi:MAG: hypothetical protein J6C93_02860 [Clostridia bacterium]|nr:hypothetical protein [Clostridia bacterium]
MAKLTAKDLDVLTHVLTGEEIACKKARVYANTLTDPALAQEMDRISSAHAERFSALLRFLEGGKA